MRPTQAYDPSAVAGGACSGKQPRFAVGLFLSRWQPLRDKRMPQSGLRLDAPQHRAALRLDATRASRELAGTLFGEEPDLFAIWRLGVVCNLVLVI